MTASSPDMTHDPAFAHRSASSSVTVVSSDGQPQPHRTVVVEQRSHAFAFGNIGFDFISWLNPETSPAQNPFGGAAPERAARLAELYLDVFNATTLPFYWGAFEPRRGQPDTARLRRTAQWFVDHGCRVKGHPLVWHTLTPDWLRELSTDEVAEAVRARIRRDVADLADVVHTWDAINEVVIMPVFSNEQHRNAITRLAWERGRLATIRLAFEEARATEPTATLLLNDFDLSTAYECLIEGVLEAGIQVDALGLQSHMHQGYWGEEKMSAILDRFARFGVPIHLTETTLLSGDLMPPEIDDLNDHQVSSWPSTPEGEERQAEEMVRHYRNLVSHPCVQAITYWGLSDDGAWLGAPSGLVRADGTPKPSYDALRDLVKGEWWLPPTTLRTDEAGRVEVRGFLGDYVLRCAGSAGVFTLAESGTSRTTVRLDHRANA